MTSRLQNAWPALLAATLSLSAYAVTLRGTFVYDDLDVFKNDDRLRQPATWAKYWTESYNGGVDNLYRPLVSMTYALQWLLHGDSHAWPFHLVNWILAAIVAALVAEMARRLLLRTSPERPRQAMTVAYLAGVLFALHPLHVEPVANIIGRAELMCAAGVISAIILLLQKPLTIGRAFAVLGCCILAVLSKEQGLLMPAILLLAAAWLVHPPALLRPATDPSRERERRAWVTLTMLICWLFTGYILFREHFLKFGWDRKFIDISINPLVRPDADKWLVPVAIAGRYALLFIAPTQLSPDYGGAVIGYKGSLFDPFFWIGVVSITSVAVLFFALLLRWWRNRPAVGVGLFCLTIALLSYGMVSNFSLQIGTNFGERLMYLPSAFLAVLAAIALARLPQRLLLPVMVLLATLMASRTITYAARWNDRTAFYEWASRQQPRSVRLHMLIVADRLARDDLDGAAVEAAAGRAVLPDYDEIWIQSADVAIAQGHFDEARKMLMRAMELRPSMKAAGRMPRTSPATNQ